LTHWSRRSASRPLHDNTAEREQNPHSGHYNGLAAFEGPILTVKSRKQIGLPERRLSSNSKQDGSSWLHQNQE